MENDDILSDDFHQKKMWASCSGMVGRAGGDLFDGLVGSKACCVL